MTMTTPKVSVVIPAYKSAQTIVRTLQSVLNQTVPLHEIIVVDDGSPDDQVEIIERNFGNQVILVRQKNAGAANARNAGISRATGDFITFLDADDYWEAQKTEKQLSVFREHPQLGMVAGKFYSETPGEPRTPWSGSPRSARYYDRILKVEGPEAFHVGTMVTTIMVMVRRSVLGDHRFCSAFEPAEDRDLWIRIISQNPVYLTEDSLATAVLVPGSLSRSSIDRDCQSMLNVVHQHSSLLGPHATRKWKAHTLARWAANDPDPIQGLRRGVYSMSLWPLPFWGIASRKPLARIRRIVVLSRKAILRRDS